MKFSFQCLSVTISFIVVLCTGLVVGVLSVLTAQNAIGTAWDAGDRSVETCLKGATDNTELVTGRLLDSILDEVEVDIQGFLTHPQVVVEELSTLYREQDAQNSTSPAYTDVIIRPIIASVARAVHKHGVIQMSTETPEGGFLASTLADSTIGILPANGEPIFLNGESARPDGSFGWDPYYFALGNSDGRGQLDHPKGTPCHLKPDYTTTPRGSMGYCYIPWSILRRGVWNDLQDRVMDNYKTTNGPLATPDEVHFSPISQVAGVLSIFAYGSWTNPGVPNGPYPRRAHRGGSIKVAFTTKEISKIMKGQTLPDGSVLYGVQKDQWEGTVGMVVGSSVGLHQTIEIDREIIELNKAVPIFVTNHTDETGNETIVARHGKYALALTDGYASLARSREATNKTSQYDIWQDGRTTYWSLTAVVTRLELQWYVTLLVPRDQLMHEIDRSITTIKATRDEEKSKADADQRKGYALMIIVATATTLGLLVVSVVFNLRVISPILKLQTDMANVAVMRLELVDLNRQSSLKEVADMQKSFYVMVKNLIEYKNYIPQAILVSEDDDSSTVFSESSFQPSRYSSHMSSPHQMSTDHYSMSTSVLPEEGLKRKMISVIYVNVSRWHSVIQGLTDLEIIATHSDYLVSALSVVNGSKGVPETFIGDRLVVTFNAVVPCSGHRLSALGTAFGIKELIEKKSVLKISYSCASGEAKVGSMGCSGMKRMAILSSVLPWAAALEALNKSRSTRGLIDHFMYKDTHQKYVLRCVDGVDYKKRLSNIIRIYEVVGGMTLKEEEWMYQLDEAESRNPYSHWNTAMSKIISQDWEGARDEMEKIKILPEDHDNEMMRIRSVIQSCTYNPQKVSLH
eukprot:TRINITY_DN1238_c4_g1_i1.p1 TRINITY_DN1238_c4_g1~~TRINITY_DN1238_c4_g1_i1.p1  ORF type:complete len:874 (+),score=85.91 TRINITY_DN1238_c4_g1_i1:53-2623(+)